MHCTMPSGASLFSAIACATALVLCMCLSAQMVPLRRLSGFSQAGTGPADNLELQLNTRGQSQAHSCFSFCMALYPSLYIAVMALILGNAQHLCTGDMSGTASLLQCARLCPRYQGRGSDLERGSSCSDVADHQLGVGDSGLQVWAVRAALLCPSQPLQGCLQLPCPVHGFCRLSFKPRTSLTMGVYACPDHRRSMLDCPCFCWTSVICIM